MNLSRVRRKKIQERKNVIKNRSQLPPRKKKDTYTSYSSYLKILRDQIRKIQKLLDDMRELADEQTKD